MAHHRTEKKTWQRLLQGSHRLIGSIWLLQKKQMKRDIPGQRGFSGLQLMQKQCMPIII